MQRISQLAINRQKNHYAQISDSLLSANVNNPIRIGLFYDGEIVWKYPDLTEFRKEQQPVLTIMSMNCSSEYEMIKFCLSTDRMLSQNVKIVVQYQNLNDGLSTAYYSPSESAIVSFSEEGELVSLVGGSLNGKSMKQYCIHEREKYTPQKLQNILKRGQLPMSWIAKGNLCSTFTLETDLPSNSEVEGAVWIFHSNCEEKVKYRKREMTSGIV